MVQLNSGHLSAFGLYYFNARYQNPTIGKFVSQDPSARDNPENFLADPQQLNYYSYGRDNPIINTDPTGKYVGVDDLAAIGIGGTISVGATTLVSLFTGQPLTWGKIAGSFATGGIMGEATLYAPTTGGASLAVGYAVATGVVASGAGNAIQQGVDIKTGAQDHFSGKSLAVNSAVGGLTNGFSEGFLPDAAIPGLSSGQGNMNAVGKGLTTKILNGEVSSMSASTAFKSAVGSQAANAYGTALSLGVDAGVSVSQAPHTSSANTMLSMPSPNYSTPGSLLRINSK